MKRLLLFLLIFTSVQWIAKGQNPDFEPYSSFGIKQGINYTTVSFSPGVSQSMTLGYHGGLVYKYNNQMTEKGWLFALQIELNYSQKGWTEDLDTISNSYSRKMDYIEMPFITQVVLGKKSLKYYINLGTSVGYLLSEKESVIVNNELYRREYYEKAIENNVDFGALGEFGLLYETNIGFFQAGIRYQLSLTNLFETTSETIIRTSQNTTWNFSISYFFYSNNKK